MYLLNHERKREMNLFLVVADEFIEIETRKVPPGLRGLVTYI